VSGEDEYRITFNHLHCTDTAIAVINEDGSPKFNKDGSIVTRTKKKTRKAVTTCNLIVQDNKKDTEIRLSGYSECGLKDNFDKEKGRKNSLADALKNIPREFREDAWAAYFDRHIPSIEDQMIENMQDMYSATQKESIKKALDEMIESREEKRREKNRKREEVQSKG